jgi:ribosomal protein S18 acetylase RimI-like enzyme
VNVRPLGEGDASALQAFFEAVPAADRTFFKEDIDVPDLAERWVRDERCVRMLGIGEEGSILAFGALVPGVQRTSHVADLRLVIAGRARGRGLGTALAQRMLLEAVRHGFLKVTVEVAAERTGPIEMFLALGFQAEALLRDQLRDPDGALHDLVILAHSVRENWSAMLTAGLDEAGPVAPGGPSGLG